MGSFLKAANDAPAPERQQTRVVHRSDLRRAEARASMPGPHDHRALGVHFADGAPRPHRRGRASWARSSSAGSAPRPLFPRIQINPRNLINLRRKLEASEKCRGQGRKNRAKLEDCKSGTPRFMTPRGPVSMHHNKKG